MSELVWNFQLINDEGGVTADLAKSIWRATGHFRSEDIVRESVQNSCQALRKNQKAPEINFKFESLEEKERNELFDLLKMHQPDDKGFEYEWPDPFNVLIIEDFNTEGLNGEERKSEQSGQFKQSNFVALCRMMGDTIVAGDRPGSHGAGKGVFWANCLSNVVLFFSRFEPDERTEQNYARFLGSGFFNSQDRYSGFAKLGNPQEENYTAPLIDQEAIDFVGDKLDFLDLENRKKEDASSYGTSVIIPGINMRPDVALKEFKSAVEKNFWPRLVTNRLDVNFFVDGNFETTAEVEKRADLEPYIRCYKLIGDVKQGNEPETGTHTFAEELEYRDDKLGIVSAIKLSESRSEEDFVVPTDRVCRFRRWGMVVEYRNYQKSKPYAAVFEASEEINDILVKTEPKGHDEWDKESTDLNDQEKNIVSKVWQKARDAIRDFLREFEDDREDIGDCPDLSKELGKLIPSDLPGSNPPPTPRPVSIQYPSPPTPIEENGHLYLESEISIKPIMHRIVEEEEEYERIKIFLKPIILMEGKKDSGDYLKLKSVKVNGNVTEFQLTDRGET